MSLLGRGERRRGKIAAALTTVGALAAFQALAIVGAGVAGAVTGCTYNPGTQAINITIDPGQTAAVAVEGDGANLDAESPNGAILFNNNGAGFENGALATQCGSATVSNTTSITVLGSPSTTEIFTLEEALGDRFPTTMAWAVDLGSGVGDRFQVNMSEDLDNTVTFTGTTFDLNGGTGPLLGVEIDWAVGNVLDDTIDGSTLPSSVTLVAVGGAGDDWIAPGFAAALPVLGDILDGGAGGEVNGDTLSYGSRTTTVYINNATGLAGHDNSGDGVPDDAGDEADLFVAGSFENLESGSANDTLIGANLFEWFIPGDGDDKITGFPGEVIDFSTASAAVTIDVKAGSATGQGTDTWTGVDGWYGSDFDDVLIWDTAATAAYFAGGGGVDTIDASAKTTGQTIDLDVLDGTCNCTENAIGGSGGDTLRGNIIGNVLTGNDGNDSLSGFGGNDTFFGGLGNDSFSGGDGGDTVDFGQSPAKMDVDVLLGIATGEGDDSLTSIEVVKGSAFNDTITGGGGLIATNFRITGRGGNDILTGSGSNDTLKGGAGNDKLRGLEGGDTLVGGKGKKDKAWGGPGTDVCKGAEFQKSCEV